jgi:V-type H+-transporting ATPase subunit E
VEKQQIVEDEKKRIKNEVEKKEQSLMAKQKIEYSSELNKMRLGVLNRRNEGLQSILTDAKSKLSALSNDKKKYTQLLKQLILQASKCLHLNDVLVRCRKEDIEIANDAMQQAQSEAVQKLGTKLSAKLDNEKSLASGPKGNKEEDFDSACLGGVVVLSTDRQVRCTQTLEERLRISYASNMPSVRQHVFDQY